jgi:low temperature requirement protein LtrA
MSSNKTNIWWGPPKRFSAQIVERKISWLELFYDLVYVIVISKVTHHLAEHPSASGILDYAYLFTMVFWGWFNGSMHHDLHGTPGIRTRFMTLWQMVAVGALAVTLSSAPEHFTHNVTIAFMFLQLFITYLWWSIGIYDKKHRKLNVPYTVCYLTATAILLITLFLPAELVRPLQWFALGLNYTPFVYTAFRIRNTTDNFSLSANMTERLGLFAIIVFGEAILGVINSLSGMEHLTPTAWICFGLGVLIVFELWWIFFAVIADREAKSGMINANILSFLYIPTLASLGMIGAAFPSLFNFHEHEYGLVLRIIFGLSIAIFTCNIAALSQYLHFSAHLEKYKKKSQRLILAVGVLNLLLLWLIAERGSILYLSCVFLSLLLVVVIFTHVWFKGELNKITETAVELEVHSNT